KMVAITGTNGKTTVTTLVAAMITASGRRAIAAGNIGLPLVDAVGRPADVVVAEVSSFQLQFTESFRPDVSCWLNLAEDHLDWHPTLAHYAAAKARIWAAQGPGDVAVLGADDPAVMAAAGDPAHGLPAGVTRWTFSTSGPADFSVDRASGLLTGPGASPLVEIGRLRRALPHDLTNGLAAAACALAVGATAEGCRQALEGFEPLPHRVELVADAAGVRWYDDSKATTPASELAAVAGFDSVVLIAGGRNKGLDLGVLATAVPPVRAVVAIGEAACEVEEAFRGRVQVMVARSMADAVATASQVSRPGDAVLLSPACASFDWYRNYAERGQDFAALVTAQLGRAGKEA
ncbi:MAG TPA: UDP-N-acetylmuramoyl-L-alanine--D-glutamate ligase, partial [Acidimicrobiales bacterium]|nr:UDP-N-acetylmuramoyl-L-alanine--D-glutamate ligase [Acidimicrobiales bacterium]